MVYVSFNVNVFWGLVAFFVGIVATLLLVQIYWTRFATRPGCFITTANSLDRSFRAAYHRPASANQNVTINIRSEKPEQWPSCLFHKLKRSNGRKGWWIPNFPSKWERTFADEQGYQRQWNETNYIYLNAGIRFKSSYIPAVNTVPHGGLIECFESSADPLFAHFFRGV